MPLSLDLSRSVTTSQHSLAQQNQLHLCVCSVIYLQFLYTLDNIKLICKLYEWYTMVYMRGKYSKQDIKCRRVVNVRTGALHGLCVRLVSELWGKVERSMRVRGRVKGDREREGGERVRRGRG